jgi:imidazolonepropionase-like amidohydrolase
MKDDQLGTLEVGKFADMVVLDGDPLANAANLLNVVMVIKNGEIVKGQ